MGESGPSFEPIRSASSIVLDRGPTIVGSSPALIGSLRTVLRVAPSPATVLICGESGTGKELLARAIHAHSPRARAAFVPVNCAAIPENLLESELFGHERGAFTGAVRRRRGRFEVASGGTLFLDEIGDMAPVLQAKILRVLEERVVDRVGGERSLSIDVRVVAASNHDLREEVDAGQVREDLYHRLAVVVVRMPPLRERGQDIYLLAEHFVRHFASLYSRREPEFAAETLERLAAYDWPGNVRELKNAIERAVLMTDEDRILPRHLPAHVLGAEPVMNGVRGNGLISLEELERRHILKVLRATDGHRGRASEILGIHRNTLRRKLRQLGLG